MNYELAKKLKEAGFPQDFDFAENVGSMLHPDIHFPTLSELIEACGERFRSLLQHSVREDGHKWCAKAGKRAGGFLKNGKTPEEAVAKLWLSLQDKDI